MTEEKPTLPAFSLNRRALLKWGLAAPLGALTLSLPFQALAKATASSKKVQTPPPATEPAPLEPTRKPTAPRLLMLDPGHGGNDPGAIGVTGTHEKNITLDIAKRIQDILSDVPGLQVKMTRETDIFLPLTERVNLAHEAHADMFLSIHADSAPNPAARGLSAYTLSEKASDNFARDLADQENHADAIAGIDLSQTEQDVAEILLDLTARRTRNMSQRVKVSFVQGMGEHWRLLEHPMRAANFVVLRSPDIPSMLVETGFLSNRSDESLLTQPKIRQKIAALMSEQLSSLLLGPLFG